MVSEHLATDFTADDYRHMSHALQLARRGIYSCHPNPRVGCVIVRSGKVIGEGWHEKAGEAHAEVMALANAGSAVEGATAYVTLEPCSHHGRTPPCADALVESGLAEVIVAMQDPNPRVAGSGIQKLEAAGIMVKRGLLQQQAEEMNRGFISRMKLGRPWVTIKLGMSIDGRTAMSSGESKWITGADARADVQKLRASSSAILTGSGTVLADDPSLSVRLDGISHQPLRVVMDSHLSVPDNAKIYTDGLPLLVVTAVNENDERFISLVERDVDVRAFTSAESRVDTLRLLQSLASEYACNEVLVEAGAVVCGSLLASHLVDEIVFYVAPVIMGADARGTFAIPGLDSMADRVRLSIRDVRPVGKDWRISAVPVYE